MSKIWERLYNGIIKENPTFIQTLGMCPTLAVTTSMINGIGMGLSSTMVLVASNILISLLKKFIPNTVRIPAYIVVIASLVTIVQFVLQGFVPELYSSLGIYIPLIVVNCIILGRAEAYASKSGVLPSIFDGLGMGLGFTMALAILGFIRELIGNGTILSDGANALVTIPGYTPASIAILAPGAFFVLAFVIAVMNKIKKSKGMPPAEVPDYTQSDSCAGCAAVGICRPDKAPKADTANAAAKPAGAKPAQVAQQEKKTVGEAVAAAKAGADKAADKVAAEGAEAKAAVGKPAAKTTETEVTGGKAGTDTAGAASEKVTADSAEAKEVVEKTVADKAGTDTEKPVNNGETVKEEVKKKEVKIEIKEDSGKEET